MIKNWIAPTPHPTTIPITVLIATPVTLKQVEGTGASWQCKKKHKIRPRAFGPLLLFYTIVKNALYMRYSRINKMYIKFAFC